MWEVRKLGMIASFWEMEWDASPRDVVSSPSLKGCRQASGHTAQREGRVAVGEDLQGGPPGNPDDLYLLDKSPAPPSIIQVPFRWERER